MLSVASFREVIGPLARQVGERLGALLGVNEDIGLRLRRTHAELDVTTFRVRQLGWAGVGFVVIAYTLFQLRSSTALFVFLAANMAFPLENGSGAGPTRARVCRSRRRECQPVAAAGGVLLLVLSGALKLGVERRCAGDVTPACESPRDVLVRRYEWPVAQAHRVAARRSFGATDTFVQRVSTAVILTASGSRVPASGHRCSRPVPPQDVRKPVVRPDPALAAAVVRIHRHDAE
jgi:hypothetical protein